MVTVRNLSPTEAVGLPRIKGKVLLNEPLSRYTSFRIGGPADVLATAADVSDLRLLLEWSRRRSERVFVLGAGTNLLVSDNGVRGAVIRLGSAFGRVHICGSKVVAGAGAKISALVRKTADAGLSGLEGLAGIPGTVGGAVRMNAGTPNGCIQDVLESVRALEMDGRVVELPDEALDLHYRWSAVGHRKLIITEASFLLRPSEPDEIRERVDSFLSRRNAAQPVGARTAGSAFKNPPGGYAGQILEAVGAKGMRVGGARVSTKHANFIVNAGAATAADVSRLMHSLQKLVLDRFGIRLEPEIELVGEW